MSQQRGGFSFAYEVQGRENIPPTERAAGADEECQRHDDRLLIPRSKSAGESRQTLQRLTDFICCINPWQL